MRYWLIKPFVPLSRRSRASKTRGVHLTDISCLPFTDTLCSAIYLAHSAAALCVRSYTHSCTLHVCTYESARGMNNDYTRPASNAS